ncbi:hypothetical protein BDZ94DRAFT_1248551 [Collybia nuda]|uniref:Uncharacterized protein n=1 Tax=Collybia nuda TaxID=64659 RepID=A0A9P5YHA9_9AGAR|nr:hypothetical protein BDZ94DRAFT_1248551 [Collybia nuda]
MHIGTCRLSRFVPAPIICKLAQKYDARLLLDSLPVHSAGGPEPSSPGGWSDLPSDAEDTFFFSPEEVEDFRRDKRRRLIDRNREERLRARRAEDGEASEEEEVWGGSDEEPEEAQKELMRRTASHLLSSPNPAQLEMRILANHGSDKRFAFLRGRWSRTWKMYKGKARMEKEAEEKKKETAKGLGILAGYGDSDVDSDASDGDDETKREHPETAKVEQTSVPDAHSTEVSTDLAQEARRIRAKEWAEKRRALKEGN